MGELEQRIRDQKVNLRSLKSIPAYSRNAGVATVGIVAFPSNQLLVKSPGQGSGRAEISFLWGGRFVPLKVRPLGSRAQRFVNDCWFGRIAQKQNHPASPPQAAASRLPPKWATKQTYAIVAGLLFQETLCFTKKACLDQTAKRRFAGP